VVQRAICKSNLDHFCKNKSQLDGILEFEGYHGMNGRADVVYMIG
jgi:hypothetical protein